MGKKEQNTKTNPLIGHLNVRKLKLRQSHTGAEKNINTYKKTAQEQNPLCCP